MGACGDMFADEAVRTKTALKELRQMVEAKDSASLMRGTFGSIMSANLTALKGVADHVELRRAALVSGTPSTLIAAALAGGAK